MKSRVMVLIGPTRLELRELPIPGIGMDDGLLRVDRCGLCGSDIEIFNYGGVGNGTRFPVIPGHEPVGTIEEIGSLAAERWGVCAGDRVVVESSIPCRHCEYCEVGLFKSCKKRVGIGSSVITGPLSLTGGFADYLYLHPNCTVHKISKDVPLDIAATFNALACGVAWAAEVPGTKLGDTVVVLGAGQRGLASVLAAKAVGASTVILTGLAKDARKFEIARRLGADCVVNVEEDDVVSRTREMTDGHMADVVIDVVPEDPVTVMHALEVAKARGTVVFAGHKGGRQIPGPVADMIISKTLSVHGVSGKESSGYRKAVQIMQYGGESVSEFVSQPFPLERASEAIQALATGGEDGEIVFASLAPQL